MTPYIPPELVLKICRTHSLNDRVFYDSLGTGEARPWHRVLATMTLACSSFRQLVQPLLFEFVILDSVSFCLVGGQVDYMGISGVLRRMRRLSSVIDTRPEIGSWIKRVYLDLTVWSREYGLERGEIADISHFFASLKNLQDVEVHRMQPIPAVCRHFLTLPLLESLELEADLENSSMAALYAVVPQASSGTFEHLTKLYIQADLRPHMGDLHAFLGICSNVTHLTLLHRTKQDDNPGTNPDHSFPSDALAASWRDREPILPRLTKLVAIMAIAVLLVPGRPIQTLDVQVSDGCWWRKVSNSVWPLLAAGTVPLRRLALHDVEWCGAILENVSRYFTQLVKLEIMNIMGSYSVCLLRSIAAHAILNCNCLGRLAT